MMTLKESLFTGFYSVSGEKIYLGDIISVSILDHLDSVFVVQYDDDAHVFCMTPYGNDYQDLPFRYYPLEGNLDEGNSKYQIIGNILFNETIEEGDVVKITVYNKGDNFLFGNLVKVSKVEEWNVVVKAHQADEVKNLNFGEFIKARI